MWADPGRGRNDDDRDLAARLGRWPGVTIDGRSYEHSATATYEATDKIVLRDFELMTMKLAELQNHGEDQTRLFFAQGTSFTNPWIRCFLTNRR